MKLTDYESFEITKCIGEEKETAKKLLKNQCINPNKIKVWNKGEITLYVEPCGKCIKCILREFKERRKYVKENMRKS